MNELHTIETLAYAAGLIDAEGCIHVSLLRPSKANRRVSPRYDLFLKIPNTYLPVLEWLKSNFGGAIVEHHSRKESRVGETWKMAWTWQCSGRTAQNCLELVLPHLKIKSEQATFAVEFQQFNQDFLFYHQANREQEMIDRRESYRQQINSLTRAKQSWMSSIADPIGDMAYTAGFFDGEGSIIITTEKRSGGFPKHRMRIKVANTDHTIIEWLRMTFNGGYVSDNMSEGRQRKANEKPAWEWRFNGSEAQCFLKRIQSFLIIKKEQARLAIELEEYLHTLSYASNRTKEVFDRCESYRTQISDLNRLQVHVLLSSD